METDPASLDPELRNARLAATASAALGLLSLCGGVIPICGGIASVLGILLGIWSLKVEPSRVAQVGIGISILGLLVTLVYTVMLAYVL